MIGALWTHVEGHPRDGLVMGDLRSFGQLQRQFLVVEGYGEYGPWRRPSSYHQVMKRHLGLRIETTRGLFLSGDDTRSTHSFEPPGRVRRMCVQDNADRSRCLITCATTEDNVSAPEDMNPPVRGFMCSHSYPTGSDGSEKINHDGFSNGIEAASFVKHVPALD